MISLKAFSYWYPDSTQPALRNINLNIAEGEFCGIVGANGAGKSTLCYAFSGFVPHFYRGEFEGDIQIGKINIAESSLGELAGEVGLVFQNPFNQISGARFTVREEIAFGLENLGLSKKEMHKRISEVLELVGIKELADRSPFALSGGQQQRVAIASILAMQPKVLVLDEPTSQLDPRSTEDVFAALRALVRKGKTTVVLAEHKLEWLASFADRVIALNHGHIEIDDVPEKVLSSPRMLKLNIGRTQYSEAAARVRLGKRLPVTLDQAKAFLR
jgi:energy-coupling factor transporter ATP-binding protein EcfA2